MWHWNHHSEWWCEDACKSWNADLESVLSVLRMISKCESDKVRCEVEGLRKLNSIEVHSW